ncbi:unnamed protein product [Pleuronectes platessa]|uniref:Uncharacterized protein n=1 Tax=Pleuronectes platessa TaxID=8262 RepID=A0A9N7YAU9_PLEPL|nr:unnamed protein product [Pleuronectes platessa]
MELKAQTCRLKEAFMVEEMMMAEPSCTFDHNHAEILCADSSRAKEIRLDERALRNREVTGLTPMTPTVHPTAVGFGAVPLSKKEERKKERAMDKKMDEAIPPDNSQLVCVGERCCPSLKEKEISCYAYNGLASIWVEDRVYPAHRGSSLLGLGRRNRNEMYGLQRISMIGVTSSSLLPCNRADTTLENE